MIRLFIALPLPEEVEVRLGEIINHLKNHNGRIKWVNPKNIHLTLKFLGDTKPSMVDSVIDTMDSIGKNYSAISMTISKLGAFPNLNRPKVFWAGLRELPQALPQLAKEIDNGMNQLGWQPENRPFKPHLTLGRVKDPQDTGKIVSAIEAYALDPISLQLGSIKLFQSTLTPKGPIYKVLHDCPLAERFA